MLYALLNKTPVLTLNSDREGHSVAGEAAGGRLRGGPHRLAGGRARQVHPGRSRVALHAALLPAVSGGHAHGVPHLHHSLTWGRLTSRCRTGTKRRQQTGLHMTSCDAETT